MHAATLVPARLRSLARDYGTFLREEPRARAFLLGHLVDDIGVAVSGWAATLLMTNLAVTQRARASMMIPTLLCFLAGTLVSGPLADWLSRASAARLARWRWKVVIVGRAIETTLLAGMVVMLALGPPTVARVLPYLMLSAFMKTALRATRIAFSVDLLAHESSSPDERDERGEPLAKKTHLLAFFSLSGLVSSAALLVGLLIGGQVMALVGGRSWILFAVDVLTNVGFLCVLHRYCRPDDDVRAVSTEAVEGSRVRHFLRSFADGFRFLARADQRPLLALLGGSFLVEVITESYDGRMVIQHVLSGGDESVRHAELGWVIVAMLGAALLPMVLTRGASLGRLFLLGMLLDGVVIALAGHLASPGVPAAVVPFALALGIDRALTLVSTTISDVAQNSACSSAMRGRIAGSYAVVVIVGDIAAEALASMGEELWGIPGLITRVGALQVVAVVGLALLGGRGLWRLQLRAPSAAAAGVAC